MKEHLTSWSGISKTLVGRTENSIKNYFYSTVRRIQACPVIDYVIQLKHGRPPPMLPSEEVFAEAYELNKLNHLGVVMCRWLYNYVEARKTHESLYNYLINAIADEKKKSKLPQSKDLQNKIHQEQQYFNQHPGLNTAFPDQSQFYRNANFGLPFINPQHLNGVHPLLPLALYGGLGNMNANNLFQTFAPHPQPPLSNSVPQFQRVEPISPPNSNHHRSNKQSYDGTNSEDYSNISVPIPSNGNNKKKPHEHQHQHQHQYQHQNQNQYQQQYQSPYDAATGQLQQALLNMLVQNLATAVDSRSLNRSYMNGQNSNLPGFPSYGNMPDPRAGMPPMFNMWSGQSQNSDPNSRICYKCAMRKDGCRDGSC